MLSHFPPTILRFSFAPPPSKSYNLIIRIVAINKIHQLKGSDFNMSKKTFLKYGFVVLFIGIFLLRAQKFISEPLSYLFSGILLLIVAYLILVKKMNFFSSLLTVYRSTFFYPTTIRSNLWSCQFIDWFTSGNS